MGFDGQQRRTVDHKLRELTAAWGTRTSVSLYLTRCQVDTPDTLVAATWKHVRDLRSKVGKVVDFGAGDGRFAQGGRYERYIGYEIDRARSLGPRRPPNARLLNRCAFSTNITDADLCIGNPPFVRNQDLPTGWREKASKVLFERTGIKISGLANAWQYFFLLSLASCKADGLVALVIPYEWVSRPSARLLREYISDRKWGVSVYRLVDETFDSVLTTASITIIDKSSSDGAWRYFEEAAEGKFKEMPSPSGSKKGVVQYLRRAEVRKGGPRASRGLSPGTQKVLTLTEGERVRTGLAINRDVVPCVTTLRHLTPKNRELDAKTFAQQYRNTGQKCWLIRTDRPPSGALARYLNSVPTCDYQTATCLEREEWWKFRMPNTPAALISMCFHGRFPKAVKNTVGARAVGGVYGIYDVSNAEVASVCSGLNGIDLRKRVVAHSNNMRKIEVNQLNALLAEAFPKNRKATSRRGAK